MKENIVNDRGRRGSGVSGADRKELSKLKAHSIIKTDVALRIQPDGPVNAEFKTRDSGDKGEETDFLEEDFLLLGFFHDHINIVQGL